MLPISIEAVASVLRVRKVGGSLIKGTEALDDAIRRTVDLRGSGFISLNSSNIGIGSRSASGLLHVASVGFRGDGDPPGHCGGEGGSGIDDVRGHYAVALRLADAEADG